MKIFRIQSIPNMCREKPKYTLIYRTEEFSDLWFEFWSKIAKILEYLSEYFDEKSKQGKELDLKEKINLVIDFIVWSMRAPVFLDTIEDVVYSPYKYYIFMRLQQYLPEAREIEPLYWIKMMEVCNPFKCEFTGLPECILVKKLFAKCDGFIGAYRELEKFFMEEISVDDMRIRRWIYLISYPADTRPGYNTSSLIVHSILVSALSWIIASFHKHDQEDALLYSLAGLLHDIGKPIDPRRHVEKSVEFVEKVLGKQLKKILGDRYIDLLNLIRSHHRDDILKIADQLAAGERNSAFVLDVIKSLLVKVIEKLRRKVEDRKHMEYLDKALGNPVILYEYSSEYGYDYFEWLNLTWEVWSMMHELLGEELEELNEQYAESIWKKDLEIKPRRFAKQDLIRVLGIDIRRVQETINRSRDLRIMAVSSYLINLWLISYLPSILNHELKRKYGLYFPLSCIVMSSGGILLSLIPSDKKIVNDLVKSIREKYCKVDALGLNLSVSVRTVEYSPYYRVAIEELFERITVDKLLVEKTDVIHPGLGAKCDLCGIKPASYIIVRDGESIEVCTECFIKWNIASKLVYGKHKLLSRVHGFLAKDILLKCTGEAPESDLMRYLIEQIAGLPPNPRMHYKMLNYSVLNIDGNLMGYYMSKTNSFTEAIEKSYRIDYALKISLHGFADLLESAITSLIGKDLNVTDSIAGLREKIRFYLGILYAGGDDARVAIPSYIAIPFTVYMAYKFNEELGCTASLAIGITSGPPKHSIWGLNDASHGLMEIVKENIGRKQALSLINGDKDDGIGCFNLYFTDSTSMLTSARVEEFYKGTKGLSNNYLLISRKEAIQRQHLDIVYLIKNLFNITSTGMEELVKELIRKGYLSIMSQCGYDVECLNYYICSDKAPVHKVNEQIISYIDRNLNDLRSIRNKVRELMGIYSKYESSEKTGIQASILYAKIKGYDEFLKILIPVLKSGDSTPLINIFMITKTIGGGSI